MSPEDPFASNTSYLHPPLSPDPQRESAADVV